MKKGYNPPVTFRLDAEVLKRVEEMAKRESRTRGNMLAVIVARDEGVLRGTSGNGERSKTGNAPDF